MPTRQRLLLISLASLGCSFDATGLGGAAAGSSGASDPGGSSAAATTTTGVAPTTGDVPTTTTTTTTAPTTSGPVTASEGSDTSSTGPLPRCGDGVVDTDEACDDGPDNGDTRPCTSTCAVNVCGDGHPLAGVEACDDGNAVDNDECRNDCTVTPACGNSKLDRGEQCDDGNALDDDACVACQMAVCGDGSVYLNVESCDDGEASATCNADCSFSKCGDMKLNPAAGEVCDLGPQNGLYASGCGADCTDLGTSCGDGIVTAPDENCDPAKPPPNAMCTADCKDLICPDGRDSCDGVFTNGCEIDLKKDKNNCGECGEVCQIVPCKDGDCKL